MEGSGTVAEQGEDLWKPNNGTCSNILGRAGVPIAQGCKP
jgi:hypothetical protein